MSKIKELMGKTLITGGAAVGKSLLLTSIVQTTAEDERTGATIYYGTSESYEKFALLKLTDNRFQFMPVYQYPFNKNSPGVVKLIRTVKSLHLFPSGRQLLIAIDEPHHLFPNKALAIEFAEAVCSLGAYEKPKLNLVMTASTADDFARLFGDKLLYDFENHLLLKNERQVFYDPLVLADAIERGAVVPIVRGERKAPFHFEMEMPDESYRLPLSVMGETAANG